MAPLSYASACRAFLALAPYPAVLTNAAAPAFLALAPYPAVLTNAAAPACFACLLACNLLQGPISPGYLSMI
jgi:hypothetical protein